MATDPAQVTAMNTALFQLGKSPVFDLTTASLATSAAATKLYPQMEAAKKSVLERHGWADSLTYANIPAPAVLQNDSNWKYSAVYQLPGNFVVLWLLQTFDALGLPYTIFDELNLIGFGLPPIPPFPNSAWEVNKIDTDQGAMPVLRCNMSCGINIAYTRDCSYSAMSQHLLDAVAYDLAQRGAYNVLGDRSAANDLVKEMEGKIAMAIGSDNMKQGGQAPLAPSVSSFLRLVSR